MLSYYKKYLPKKQVRPFPETRLQVLPGPPPDYNVLLQVLDFSVYTFVGKPNEPSGRIDRRHASMHVVAWATDLARESLGQAQVVKVWKLENRLIEAIVDCEVYFTSWPENPFKSLAFFMTRKQYDELLAGSKELGEEIDYALSLGPDCHLGTDENDRARRALSFSQAVSQKNCIWYWFNQAVALITPRLLPMDSWPYLTTAYDGMDLRNPVFLAHKAFDDYNQGYSNYMRLR